jgi:4-amino-4-deoxy-L-arabinose transferase-like glycosyltransferase
MLSLSQRLQSLPVRRTTLLLVLLGWIAFFAGLGRPAISDSDEAFYAEAGREMLGSGDWTTPRYNFHDRFQKPVFFYWLVASAYAATGVSEAAARVWPAASALLLSLVTAGAARRWYDEQTARYAGAIAATCFGCFSIARLSLPDLPLALFVTVAIWSALEALQAVSTARAWWVLAAIASGLGILTKGPVALALLVLTAVPVAVASRVPPAKWVGPLALVSLGAVMLAAPWYAAMAHAHGARYLREFFVGDNIQRFATTRFNEMRPPWFYLPILAGGLLPWTPLALCGLPVASSCRLAGRAPSPATWRVVIWAAMPFLFFTISVGKEPRYILPMLPPLAILLARVLVHAAALPRAHATLRAAGACIGGFLACVGLLLYRVSPLIPMVAPELVLAAAAAAVVAGLGATAGSIFLPPRHVPIAVAIAAAVTLASLQYGLAPPGRDPVQAVAGQVRQQPTRPAAVGTFRVFVRNLVFYTGLEQTDLSDDDEARAFLQRRDHVLCALRSSDLDRLRESGPLPVHVIGSVSYLDVSAVRLRPLFARDPTRHLEQVVLVSNEEAQGGQEVQRVQKVQ